MSVRCPLLLNNRKTMNFLDDGFLDGGQIQVVVGELMRP